MKPTFRRISRTFIKGAEFKARQLWLDFCDVAGTVLEVMEPVKAAAWGWFKKWRKGFVLPAAEEDGPETLVLTLDTVGAGVISGAGACIPAGLR